jgi:uncharacterized small protein (DUF1192 family)
LLFFFCVVLFGRDPKAMAPSKETYDAILDLLTVGEDQDRIRSLLKSMVVRSCIEDRLLKDKVKFFADSLFTKTEKFNPREHEQDFLAALNKYGRSEILDSEPLRDRIAMLREGDFAPWKGRVYLELCRFVVETHTHMSYPEGTKALNLKSGLRKIIDAHLQDERVSLVGLALWNVQREKVKVVYGVQVFVRPFLE